MHSKILNTTIYADDDDVTRSTISYQGKNTLCQTFIMDGLMLYYIKLFLHLAKVD